MPEKLRTVVRMSTEAFETVGRTLGKYRILDGLALGGMAEIYVARVVGSDPPAHVVVKQIQPHLAEDESFVRMFLREAALAAQLEHANIGAVYDQGEADGLFYFAMEYLHGYDARALFDRLQRKDERMPLEHALTIVARVANGLQYAHDKRDATGKPLQIVHRDVSPSNIFVTYDGDVKLVDFGLARVADDSKLRPNTVKGKSAYLSPEQCRGEELDRRSDIFSLGIVLYELTTGTRLFRRSETDPIYTIMNRISSGDVPAPSTVVPGYPQTLEEIVLQALAVDLNKRHPTARALMLDIEAVARTEGLTLSDRALGAYLVTSFGHKTPPWEDLPDDAYDDDDVLDEMLAAGASRNAGAGAGAEANAGADEYDDFDDEPAEDEFDDDGATSLYTGNVEDIKDAWAREAVGNRTSSMSMDTGMGMPATASRASRLALPLQAEDSGEFENPLLADAGTPSPATDEPSGPQIIMVSGNVGSDPSSADEPTSNPSFDPRNAATAPGIDPGPREMGRAPSSSPVPAPGAFQRAGSQFNQRAGSQMDAMGGDPNAAPHAQQRLESVPPMYTGHAEPGASSSLTWVVVIGIVAVLAGLTAFMFFI